MITDSYALHAHLVRHLYRHGGQSFLFTTLNAAALVLVLLGEAEAILLCAWFIVCVAVAAYHWQTGARHLRLAEKGVAHHDAARLALATGVAGLGFGAAAALDSRPSYGLPRPAPVTRVFAASPMRFAVSG